MSYFFSLNSKYYLHPGAPLEYLQALSQYTQVTKINESGFSRKYFHMSYKPAMESPFGEIKDTFQIIPYVSVFSHICNQYLIVY